MSLITSLSLVCALVGQTPSPQRAAVPSLTTGQLSEPTKDSGAVSAEAAVLEAQLEEMRHANDAILSTVHWALGVAVGLVVLLVGFGAAVNFKVYERDLEALRTENRRQIDARVQEVGEQNAQLITQELTTELNTRFDSLSKRIQLLHAWDAKNDARRYEEAGHFVAAMISNSRWFDSALILGDHNAVSEALDNMRRILGHAFTISTTSLRLITNNLDKLPATYALVNSVIRDGLARKVGAEIPDSGGT
jgi:hypothetical protein